MLPQDSNAALMLAQLGEEERALKAIDRVKRRAPGSLDMRAAAAALYWHRGEEDKAEDEWSFACEFINDGELVKGGPVYDGCAQYRDVQWLEKIRRWPPLMVSYMSDFIRLRD